MKAIAIGYYGQLRVPGEDSDTFEVRDGETASWFVPVEPEPPKPDKRK